MSRQAHWESVYQTKSDDQVSWTQAEPRVSLALIQAVCPPGGRVIDVGGGTSALAGRLLDAGYSVAVLDISAAALARSRERLGERAARIDWIVADVTADLDLGQTDVWHDRAVFHFLTRPEDRAKYVSLAARTVRPGGHLVIGTFALDGPESCSGLSVERYDGRKLAEVLGPAFALVREVKESHVTPWGKEQRFTFAVFERLSFTRSYTP